jgi:hypothetical protein
MPGFDAQFCSMLEIEYIAIRKTVDLIIVYPEQFAEKIRSYCFRVANVLFKFVLDEIAYWRDQIVSLKTIITESKYYKNTRRICNDMMRCMKIFELCALKPYFGNKTAEELKANAVVFQQYVCNGKLIEAAQALLDSQITMVNGFITSVKTAMEAWVTVGLEWLISQYNVLLKLVDIPKILETLDAFMECVFGVCDIGATVSNYKSDTISRLYLNPNGQVDRSRFKAILEKNAQKIDKGISDLEDTVANIQKKASWHKVLKDTVAHPKSI